AVTSPCVPSSYNVCDELPLKSVRSAVTEMPVLAGAVAGVTATVNRLLLAGRIEFGVARPCPDKTPFAPQKFAGECELRGMGPATMKSFRLLSVSMQPLCLRMPAVVLAKVGTAAVSKHVADPYPTVSTIAP